MAKVNVKLWNRSATNAQMYEERPAVTIFIPGNKGSVYFRGHEWVFGKGKKKDELVPKPLDECIIEIEEKDKIVFQGTFDQLCNTLKDTPHNTKLLTNMPDDQCSCEDTYGQSLDTLFDYASFDFLDKMGYPIWSHNEASYSDAIDEFTKQWNELTNEQKAQKLKVAGNLTDEALDQIIKDKNINYFQ